MPRFAYRASDHSYWLNGTRIKGVTDLLTEAGLISEAWYTDADAERGRQVHELCTSRDLGAIDDLRCCDSPHKGYLLAYEAFRARVQPEWTAIEEPAVSLTYRVAGTPDRVGRLWGMEAIVDIKSGVPEQWHGVQSSCYDVILGGLPAGVRKRYGLYLKRSSKFRLIPHDGSDPSCSKGRADYDTAFDILDRFAR